MTRPRCEARRVALLATAMAMALSTGGTFASAATDDRRAYELVSPSDARVQLDNGPGNRSPGGGAWWRVGASGDRAVFSTTNISLNLGGELGVFDRYIASRGSNGWTSAYAGVPGSWNASPIHVAGTPPFLRATSRQLALMWQSGVTHPPQAPDPVEPRNPTSVRDASGRFAWVFDGADVSVAYTTYRTNGLDVSDDGTRAVFHVDPPATAPEPEAIQERTSTGLRLVSVAPNGEELAAVFRAASERSMSSDAGRIYFFARDAGGEHLFVRIDAERTVKIADSPAGAGAIRLEGVSSDGSRAMLSTTAPLTSDDRDSRPDLFLAEIDTRDDVAIERVSRGSDLASGNDETCGTTPCDALSVGLSENGSSVYFTAPEILADGGIAGARNLYVRSRGRTAHIAVIATTDGALTGLSRIVKHYGMTPDGSRFAFPSTERLTSYDNGGKRMMYVYDDASRTIVCASCHPSGAPPAGGVPDPNVTGSIAARGTATLLSADGRRVFFNSLDRLVPGDINDVQDVYEFDVDRRQLRLVSSGESPDPSELYGASADGRDAMFLTFESLVRRDRNGDGVRKLYDARIGGGFPEDVPPPPCEGDECQPPQQSGPPPQRAATSFVSLAGNRPSLEDETPMRLSVARLSRRELARAARIGRLRIRVSGLLAPVRATATARATVRGRATTVGRATRSIARGSATTLTIRMSRASRRELRRRGRLALRVTVRATAPRASTVIAGTLKSARRSR